VTLLLALLAGTLATVSPCVLPLLPIVLLGALGEHRHGPLALVAGLALSFTAAGLLVSGAVRALDIDEPALRMGSATMLVLFGALLLVSKFAKRFAVPSGALGNLAGRFAPRGAKGQFVLGALLGAAWTPCSGPALGAAIAMAAGSGTAL